MSSAGDRRDATVLKLPKSSRDRIERALGYWGSVELRCEWTALMRWEDEMLAFANESAAASDRYREALERIYKTGKGVHVEIAREALNA